MVEGFCQLVMFK